MANQATAPQATDPPATPGRASAAPLPTVRFFQGTLAHPIPIRRLSFQAGRPHRSWFATCLPAFPSSRISNVGVNDNSVMSVALRGEASCQSLAGGPALTLGDSTQMEGSTPLSWGFFEGGTPQVLAAMRGLKAGRYRLVVRFNYSWDEHTDGPTWEGRSVDLAAGELPLEVLPSQR